MTSHLRCDKIEEVPSEERERIFMKYSELSLAEADTGFRYDPALLTLYGEKRGYGIAVSDRDEEYVVTVYAEEPYKKEKDVFSEISALEPDLPKNALLGQRCGLGAVEIRLRRDLFLQERLPALFAFSDKIIAALAGIGINGAPVKLPEPPAPAPEEKKETAEKTKSGFGLKNVRGLIGAVIGAAAMAFIAMASVDLRSKSGIGGTVTELGSYVLAAAATLLVFSDYRFLARKLDAFGVIACPILSVLCAVFSALLATAKAFAAADGIPFSDALSRLSELYEAEPEIAAFGAGYLLTGVVISGFASLLYCLWYFNKHPDEMIKSEKSEPKR